MKDLLLINVGYRQNDLNPIIFQLFRHMKELIIYSTNGTEPSMKYKEYPFNILNLMSIIESEVTHKLKIIIKAIQRDSIIETVEECEQKDIESESWIHDQYDILQRYCKSNEKYSKFDISLRTKSDTKSKLEDILTIVFNPF